MRAAVCHSYGPPEVVRVEDAGAPAVGAGHVRIQVAAAAVNFPDVLVVADRYQLSAPTPFIPGSEFAGVVVEIAEDVTGIACGELVMGTGFVGAFAEQVVVPADALRRVPNGTDVRAAAAFGVAHRTAYHVLRSVVRVENGEDVVVLGAGGGVGLAAVRIASLLGATVTAVASSSEKLDVAAACGAHHLVDRRSGHLRELLRGLLPDGADVVVDPVGGDLAEPALRSLRWGGRFVTVGYASGAIPCIPLNLVLLKGAVILGFQFRDFALNDPAAFRRNEDELMELFAAGRVPPHVGAVFALDDVSAALRVVADGRAVGKVVLDVGGSGQAPLARNCTIGVAAGNDSVIAELT